MATNCEDRQALYTTAAHAVGHLVSSEPHSYTGLHKQATSMLQQAMSCRSTPVQMNFPIKIAVMRLRACSRLPAVIAAPLRRPVRRAAMRPTFCPGGASRRTVDACPIC